MLPALWSRQGFYLSAKKRLPSPKKKAQIPISPPPKPQSTHQRRKINIPINSSHTMDDVDDENIMIMKIRPPPRTGSSQ